MAKPLPLPRDPADDPVAGRQRRAADVQSLLDDPGTARLTLSTPHRGDQALPEAIDGYSTSEVLMHAWDLSRAADLPDPIDWEVAEGRPAGMTEIESLQRSSGQYGPALAAPEDATPGDRLMAFLGRDASRTA